MCNGITAQVVRVMNRRTLRCFLLMQTEWCLKCKKSKFSEDG